MVKAYMQWRVLLRTARIAAAEVQKRQLGTHGVYLGARLMVGLGYLNVPEAKLLTAITRMTALLAGTLDKDTARRLFGLLVHLVILDASFRATTAGLWASTGRTRVDPVHLTVWEAARARRWLDLLQNAAAVALDEAVIRSRRRRATDGGLRLMGQSDSCREQASGYAALGGYSHGTAWRLVLPQRAVEILPNSANEFLAFLVHLLVNQVAHATATQVLHALDNVNAALATAKDSAKAPIMLAIYDEMIELPAYKAVSGKLLTAHWFGGRLRLADAASRGHEHVLREVTAALQIRLVIAEPPEAADALVGRVIDAQERLLLLQAPQPTAGPKRARAEAESTGAHPPSRRRALTSVERGTSQTVASALCNSASNRFRSARRAPPLTTTGERQENTRASTIPAPATDPTGGLRRARRAAAPLTTTGVRVARATNAITGITRRAHVVPLRRQAGTLDADRLPGGRGAAASITGRLQNDTSTFALRPADPRLLERMGLSVHQYADYGANAGTLKQEKSALGRYWGPYVKRMRTPFWRTDEAQRDPQRESLLQAGFVIDTWHRMAPRSKKNMKAQVRSAFNVLGHVRRAHARKGYDMPPPLMLSHVARGMEKEMLVNYGKHAQLPARAEPFTADQNARMLAIPGGAVINGRPYGAATPFWRGWRLVDTFANQTGERKSGIVGHELGGYTRADALIVLGGGDPIADPSPAQLAQMGATPNDYVIVRNGPSKADRGGKFFGPTPTVFTFDRQNISNFAAALVDFELAHPCRGAARATAPLFVQDGKVKAWTASAIDRTLDGVMQAVLSPTEREHKTFHSKRVWLASALKANKVSDGEVQALCRWMSADSLRLYARMDWAYQGRCREEACSAQFQTINATSLPVLDPIRYGENNSILMPDLRGGASTIETERA